MYLASIKELSAALGTSDDTLKDQLGNLLSQATSVLGTRVDSMFDRVSRVSYFSPTEGDLRVRGGTVALRLPTGFISSDDPITLRLSGGAMLGSPTDGVEYTAPYMVDHTKGVVHVPTTALSVGNFTVSISYVSGFLTVGKDYKDVPKGLKDAAIAAATKSFFLTARANVLGKYNKYNAAAVDQILKDVYSNYERPRAVMVWSALDQEL